MIAPKIDDVAAVLARRVSLIPPEAASKPEVLREWIMGLAEHLTFFFADHYNKQEKASAILPGLPGHNGR